MQRNFGGHRYPRLAHVGDRTGLEMIRTLQDHGIHQGHRCVRRAHGSHAADQTVSAALARHFGYDRERGRFKVFPAKAVVLRQVGVGRAFKVTSNSWEYTGDGHALAYNAGCGAARYGVCAIPSDRHGVAAQRERHSEPVTEGVRGEGGVLRNKEGKRFLFDEIPENYHAVPPRITKRKAGATRRATRARAVPRSC